MRQLLSLSAALALGSFALASCGDQTTQPNTAANEPAVIPQLAVASNTWVTRWDMWGTERRELATAVVPNASGQSILYAIGGQDPHRLPGAEAGAPLRDVMAYNASTNGWSRRAPLPKPLWQTNGAGVLDGKIYISGGCTFEECIYDWPSGALYMYDPVANTWTQKHGMPAGGSRGATGVINGELYVITTCVEEVEYEYYFNDCPPPSNFYRYNRVKDQWTVLPKPAGDYRYAVAGVISGKFYVTGQSGTLEMYDPATNRWTSKAPQPNPPVARAAGAVLREQLFVIGGELRPYNSTALSRTVAYDPVSNAWTTKASLPTPRVGSAASRIFINGQPRIEVVGGSRPGNNLQYIP